jgi:hypothetical protein
VVSLTPFKGVIPVLGTTDTSLAHTNLNQISFANTANAQESRQRPDYDTGMFKK